MKDEGGFLRHYLRMFDRQCPLKAEFPRSRAGEKFLLTEDILIPQITIILLLPKGIKVARPILRIRILVASSHERYRKVDIQILKGIAE